MAFKSPITENNEKFRTKALNIQFLENKFTAIKTLRDLTCNEKATCNMVQNNLMKARNCLVIIFFHSIYMTQVQPHDVVLTALR